MVAGVALEKICGSEDTNLTKSQEYCYKYILYFSNRHRFCPLACIVRELMSVSRTLCRLTSPQAVHRFWPIHARTLACSRTAAAC